MIEPLPCPFGCGPAELKEWDWPYVRYQVRCPRCKCSQGVRKADKTEAIAAWNQRARPVITDAMLEKMATQFLNYMPLYEQKDRREIARLCLTAALGGPSDDSATIAKEAP